MKNELDLNAKIELASTYLQKGEHGAAEQLYKEVLAVEPENINSLYHLAVIAYQAGRLDMGIDLLRKVESLQADFMMAQYLLGLIYSAKGNLFEARDSFQKAVGLNPGLVDAHLSLGKIFKIQNDFPEAQKSFQKVIELQPDNITAYIYLGNLYQEQGRISDSIQIYRQAESYHSDVPELYYNLGRALIQLGDLESAKTSLQKVVTLKPDYFEAFFLLGNVFQARGELARAKQHYLEALKIRKDSFEPFLNLGNVLVQLNDLPGAIECYHQVVTLKPDHPEAYIQLSKILQRLGKAEDAYGVLQKGIAALPDSPEINAAIGSIFARRNDRDRAREHYRKALSVKPEFPSLLYQWAVIEAEEGNFDLAKEMYSKVIELEPDNCDAHRNYSMLHNYSENDEHLKQMEEIVEDQDLADEKRMKLSYALGNAYEEIKNFENAFFYFAKGNSLKRKTFEFSIEQTKVFFENIKKVFDAHFVQKMSGKGFSDNTPMFVVGMPRSGTTLTEQILASHPDVFGADELKDFREVLLKQTSKVVLGDAFACLRDGNGDLFDKIGREYVERLREYSGGAKHVIDKLTTNFLLIGVILLSLPRAKIVHCRRDPMDNCFSIYKNYLSEEVLYSYSLEEVGQYYLLYKNLMQYWDELFPNNIYTLDYEDLIYHQEEETRKLLEYCELPWDPACLNFHKTDRTVTTLSLAQVRQPIYSASVKLWKKYEQNLSPLQSILSAL